MKRNIISRVKVICGNRSALRCLLAVLLISAGGGTTMAYDFEVDGIYYNVLSWEDRTVEVTNGELQYEGGIVIPEEIVFREKTYVVTTIGQNAFSDCTSLVSVDMSSVTKIGGSAFFYCTSLVSVDMPSVTEIGGSAFFYCTSLVSVDMPSVTEIGASAFSDCTSLVSVDMPSVTTIIDYAFDGCTLLSVLSLPASVTSIGESAFNECPLTTIYCHWQNPLLFDVEFDDEVLTNATLYVPAGTKSAYEAVFPWSEFENIVEMDYSSINETKVTAPTVTIIDGAIVIECERGAAQAVEVYSTGGECVHRGTDARIEGLPHGVYVVRVGQGTAKVVL